MQEKGKVILHRKYLEIAKLLNIYLNHFPKHEKYALCQQIRNCLYDIFGLITEAQKRYHKKTTLTNLDIKHEQLRMFVNLANDLGYFGFKDGKGGDEKAVHRYLTISKLIDDLGRMIGGWIAKVQERETS